MGVRWVDGKHDLLPDEEQREPTLRRELTRVSVVGLRAVSLICIGGTSLMLVFTSILKALGYLSEVWIETDLAINAVGLAATPFGRKPSLQKHARFAGCLVGLFRGLFNSRSIIHALGGEIALQSVEGSGTTVTIVLPPAVVEIK